jgi:hypothetical protein
MAVERLFAVGASGLGAAVGMEDQLPAATMNTDIMVKLTQSHAILYRGLAAVHLVAEMVNVTVDGRTTAPGPGAFPVPQEDRAANVPGDAIGVADVEREARGVVGLIQQALT